MATNSDRFNRRDALTAIGAGTVGLSALGMSAGAQDTSPYGSVRAGLSDQDLGWDPGQQKYVLPPLPYDYDALEPHIDEETMQLHHDKHHAGYVRGLNTALRALADIREGSRPDSEVKAWSRQLAFNGSGHFLHVLFWRNMSPDGGGEPTGDLAKAIQRDFGSFGQFATHFQAAASSVEGSGWGLLVFEPLSGRLAVMQAEKHQNLTAWGVTPILAVDVWEHAYYLKYQNRRKAYVEAFMNVVDWDFVAARYAGLTGASA